MTTVSSPIGDVLESLNANDLRISPALAYRSGSGSHVAGTALQSPPSNQQILDATKGFYSGHHAVVDATTLNCRDVAQQQHGYVSTLNSYNWKSQQLTQDEQNTSGNSIFGNGGGGLWDNTLNNVKADRLFTTIGVGIAADVQFFVGGNGGLGCVWDIAKREGPRGYGYAVGEIGLRIDLTLNVQCVIFNQLPSALDSDVFGLTVGITSGIGLNFSTFWQGDASNLQILGYVIGAGVGVGAGGTIFGGHVWNFG
ncbi:hypothetical protein [Geodermatophilus sp. URMC 64]